MDDHATPKTSPYRWYPQLMGICCLSHFSVHMHAFDVADPGWWWSVAVIVASGWVVLKPTCRGLLALGACQVAHSVADAPFNPDHWLLLLFINVAMLGYAGWRRLQRQTIDLPVLMAWLAPAARILFLVCYGSAAWSKFNSQFLNPHESCATVLSGFQINALPVLGYVLWPPAAAWSAALCEATIPLCLCFRRTRHVGILIGLAFHGLIVASPAVMVFDFTIVVYTALYLFTPEEFDARLSLRLRQFATGFPELSRWLTTASRLGLWAGIGLLLAISLCGIPMMEVADAVVVRRWILTMLVGAVIVSAMVVTLYSPRMEPQALRLVPHSWFAWSIVGLACGNALCPYVGLKTQGSFTMFSNLRTEGNAWNHCFMPQELRWVNGYQDEFEHVVETSHPGLDAKYVQRGFLVPRFELRRLAMQDPTVSLAVRRGGQVEQIAALGDDADLGRPLSWWERKLLIFRPIPADASPYCGN